MDLDDLDANSSEKKATYREIQQYVLKKMGIMVSVRQLQRPPEKEEVIRNTLEYFRMI